VLLLVWNLHNWASVWLAVDLELRLISNNVASMDLVVDGRECRALDVLTRCLRGMQRVVLPHHDATADGDIGDTMHSHALKDVKVHCMVVRCCRDDTALVSIPHDDIGIASNSNDSLAWPAVEYLGGIGACHGDELFLGKNASALV
jgi:hypothetical protein